MSRKTTTALRAAMIAAVATVCLQSTMAQKAEAIADPYTSSGDPCNLDCIDVFVECQFELGYHLYGGNPPPQCSDSYLYCKGHCQVFGSPFTQWWIF